ncbi:aminopeptidase 2 [Suhomyces tanzawaensis NRRL Y-17324]|uniref:Aminopeptidase n=1 Tax=Suhomyces tanzawaensis NRRL Y-17324 TaxID=984487 RepID=A0A1E4SN97_9ASCO|nr:aminopeptidase 2 [Suhomyces tanzawaensis NRRL Y-17324]ODV80897.1 aminopeptidase 2 [Suhomyces tanzawaensis NRRL Y-17324]
MCSSTPNTEREVLPTNVKPFHYNITLEPDLEKFTFDGEETIEFNVNERTDYISLNSLEITVSEANVNGVPVSSITFDEKAQTVTFKLDDHLVEGSVAKLHIKFQGILNDQMAGFYRSSYEQDGKKKYLATTQFEPTDCRRAFPSYDEPSAKATFSISLIADKDLVCLSNMDEKETTLLSDNKKKVEFNKSPLMSTYLVACIVGDLRHVDSVVEYKVPIKVYATPGMEHLGKYSADVAAKCLAFFDKKFDIDYPLPKCDMVAIHDFSAGAMENFGLITYRNTDLLIDASKADVNTKLRVTEVVAHELAHQWFGNLVTMDFWDGLWLNEGFATWMSWYAVDSLYPEWKVWESYVSDSLQHALGLDSLRSSHPVEVPVKKAEEINQIFDAISYSKGSSILKMLSKWLGEETFIKGVSNYLKKHKWGNTQTSDLWDALSAASGKDVVEVMDIWTKKIGYPVVKVSEEDGKITVTQNRFLNTNDVKPEEDETLYPIFLALKTSNGVEDLTLDSRSKTIDLSTKDDFFKINADQFGIYRTAYETSRWNKLGQAGVEGKLSVEDRVGLVADAGSLASAGYIETTNLLDLVKLWTKEENYVVWDEIINRIGAIKKAFIFSDESITEGLKSFVLDLIKEKTSSISWDYSSENLSFAEEQLRVSFFSAAVNNGDKKAIEFAQSAFEAYIAGDENAFSPSFRSIIFNAVAKNGDRKTYDKLLALLKTTKIVDEEGAILRSLGSFRDPEIIDSVLGLLKEGSIVRQQDIYKPMAGLTTHVVGINKFWAWFQENAEELEKRFPPGSSLFSAVVRLSTSSFTTSEKKAEIEKFFANKETKGYDQALAQSLDVISSKISWTQRDTTELQQWLNASGYKQ